MRVNAGELATLKSQERMANRNAVTRPPWDASPMVVRTARARIAVSVIPMTSWITSTLTNSSSLTSNTAGPTSAVSARLLGKSVRPCMAFAMRCTASRSAADWTGTSVSLEIAATPSGTIRSYRSTQNANACPPPRIMSSPAAAKVARRSHRVSPLPSCGLVRSPWLGLAKRILREVQRCTRNDVLWQQEQTARITLPMLNLARQRKAALRNAGAGFGDRAGNECQVSNFA
ncbi:hypothetical protein SAMN05518800_7017 [Variovorax sp. YR752]|nr:hypothetical protein SAMN05518800_7017 [Variovorax sp. YR752]